MNRNEIRQELKKTFGRNYMARLKERLGFSKQHIIRWFNENEFASITIEDAVLSELEIARQRQKRTAAILNK